MLKDWRCQGGSVLYRSPYVEYSGIADKMTPEQIPEGKKGRSPREDWDLSLRRKRNSKKNSGYVFDVF